VESPTGGFEIEFFLIFVGDVDRAENVEFIELTLSERVARNARPRAPIQRGKYTWSKKHSGFTGS
jgi:hypothetical protein